MGLSCYCEESSDGWTYLAPNDYSVASWSRRKRCCSCGALIAHGAIVTRFDRVRYPLTNVEERIYGEGMDVPLAPWWMCEQCSDLYFSLTELGYCIWLGSSMLELVREYATLTTTT